MSLQECQEIYGERFWFIKDNEGKEHFVYKTLAVNLLMKKYWSQKYNGDIVIFIDGPEGSGKSTLARQVAKLLDPTFNEQKIVYSFDMLKKYYFNGVPWEAIVMDESDEGVNRAETMSKTNVEFSKFMRQSRQAHKILIMCGPSIYDIAGYVSQHRVKFLIHCYLKDGLHPGHFMFFNEEGIHKLFIFDKREREYRQTPAFLGVFSSAEICDMEAYNARKKAAFEKFKNGDTGDIPKTQAEIIRDYRRECARTYLQKKKECRSLTVKAFAKALDTEAYPYTRQQAYYDFEKVGVNVNERELEPKHPDDKQDMSEFGLKITPEGSYTFL